MRESRIQSKAKVNKGKEQKVIGGSIFFNMETSFTRDLRSSRDITVKVTQGPKDWLPLNPLFILYKLYPLLTGF